MFLLDLNTRAATLIRLAALSAVSWSLIDAREAPGGSGRPLVVAVAFAAAAVAWLIWSLRALKEVRGTAENRVLGELWIVGLAGAVLTAASPSSAASAFVFVAVMAMTLRAGLRPGLTLTAACSVVLVAAASVYGDSTVGTLAYILGFLAAMLAAANSRGNVRRAEQAELLLAQTQRSQEEQIRAARLQESTRIARDLHDVLAHTLAGLVIQLEATAALAERGAPSAELARRVRSSHELARQGLGEARRAVGALRGEDGGDRTSLAAALGALIDAHRRSTGREAELELHGEPERLGSTVCDAVIRVLQESLTNVAKHAPGGKVGVSFDAGSEEADPVLLEVSNTFSPSGPTRSSLSASGGGYGITGMRERAEELGGTVVAGPTTDGWRVLLTIPASRDLQGGEAAR